MPPFQHFKQKQEFFLSNINLPSETSEDVEVLKVSWPNTVSNRRPKTFSQYLTIPLFNLGTSPSDSPSRPLNLTFTNPQDLALADPKWNVKQNGLTLLHPNKDSDEIFTNSIPPQIITSRLAFSIDNPSQKQPLLKKEGGRLVVSIRFGTGSQSLSVVDGESVQSNSSDNLLEGVDLNFAGSTLEDYGTRMIKEVSETSGVKTWTFTPRDENFLQANEGIWLVFEGLCPDATPGRAVIQIAYYGIEGYKDDVFITYVRKIAPRPIMIAPISPQELTVKNPWGDLKLSWAVFGSTSVSLRGETESSSIEGQTESSSIEIATNLPGVVSEKVIELDKPELWQDMNLVLRVPLDSGGWSSYTIAKMTYTGPWNPKWHNTELTSDWKSYKTDAIYNKIGVSFNTHIEWETDTLLGLLPVTVYEIDTLQMESVDLLVSGKYRVALKHTDARGWYLLIEIRQDDHPQGSEPWTSSDIGEKLRRAKNYNILVVAIMTDQLLLYPPEKYSQAIGGGSISIEHIDIDKQGRGIFKLETATIELENSGSSLKDLYGVYEVQGDKVVWLSASENGFQAEQDVCQLFGVNNPHSSTRYEITDRLENVEQLTAKNRPAPNPEPYVNYNDKQMLVRYREEQNRYVVLNGSQLPGTVLQPSKRQLVPEKSKNLDDRSLIKQDGQQSDFSNTDLTGVNFDGAELGESDFSDASLVNASLVDANLVLANFTYANLNAANLSGAQLNYAKLCNANLNSANLESASLIGADLSDADFTHANLTNANLATAMVTGTRFSQSADLSDEQKQDLIDRGAIFVEEPKVEMGQFPKALLDARARSAPTQSLDVPQRLDLIEHKLDTLLQHLQLTPSNPQLPTLPADLQSPLVSPTPEGNGDPESSATTSPPNEPRRNLQGVIFRGAELSNKNLSCIDFSKADLSGSDIKETNLSHTLLREANLSGADLTGADLTGADLTGANLTGTNLTGTTVSKACFDKTIGLSDEQRQALAAQSALLSQPEETVVSNADFVTDKPRVQTQYL